LTIGAALPLVVSVCWAQANAPLRLKAATEIAYFRLSGIDGYVLARYSMDDSRSVGQSGGTPLRARQSNLSEEIYLMTHSYIYHPSLLTLDVGGGPVIDKSRDYSEGPGATAKRQLFSLNARATILRDKPYTGALFYNHGNQTQSLGPAQQMLTEDTRYGATFSLLSPVTPVPLQVELTRSKNQGNGAEQVMDDRVDQLRLTMDVTLGKLGNSAFLLLSTRQASASGSANLPIQTSHSSNDRINLDTHLRFGSENEYKLSNALTLNRSSYTVGPGALADVKDFSFGLDLRGRHSEELQTTVRYDLNLSQQDDQSMVQNSVNAGLNYRFSPDLSVTLAVHGEGNHGSQYSSTMYAVDGSAQYRQSLPLGMVTTVYTSAYSKRDQQEMALETKVIGERFALQSSNTISLSKQQIAAGSVVVSNTARTQIFMEGSDYLLSQIGLETRIQRLIGGNILDGQEVLVDYAFASGGSYASSQFDNSLNLSWSYKSYLNLFVRYQTTEPRLDSGAPTSALNPVKSTFYGVRTDFPLSLGWQEFAFGASAERQVRREAVLPHQRTQFEFFAQTDLPFAKMGSIRLGKRQLQVAYEGNSLQGVNLDSIDLQMWARLGWGINLSASASRYRDTGTLLLREGSVASIKAHWRQRKFQWTLDLNHSYDAQGAVEQSRTVAQMLLKRDY
jgi:hypothetical protein